MTSQATSFWVGQPTATGLRDELPDIPGLADRWARDVLHCPYCHGWEVRDQQIAVIWNGPETIRYAQIVRQWSDDVVLFTQAETLTQAQRTQLAPGRLTGMPIHQQHSDTWLQEPCSE
jgi:thioredoxin reductase